MKPTSEERREVARRLRDEGLYASLMPRDQFFRWMFDVVDSPKTVASMTMHLADLIEPAPERTCMPIMPPYEPGVEEIPVCSECGRQMFLEDDDAYCPRCGAKVIEEES